MTAAGTSTAPQRVGSYVAEAVLLLLVVAIAVLEVVWTVRFAGYQPDCGTIATTTKWGIGGFGVVGFVVALVAAAASLRRLTRHRPDPLRAILPVVAVIATFLFWAFMMIGAGGC